MDFKMGEEQGCSNLEERCRELSTVARQWEQQINDLRHFSQFEKESLEREILYLQDERKHAISQQQILENSLMSFEDERVRTHIANEAQIQSKIEVEVKLQLMESALEAVSLTTEAIESSQDNKNEMRNRSTCTSDLNDSILDATCLNQHNPTTKKGKSDAETQSLQLELRKLRHELIVSQISAKQFKSECLLYRARAMHPKKRKVKGTKEYQMPVKRIPRINDENDRSCIDNQRNTKTISSVRIIDDASLLGDICLRI